MNDKALLASLPAAAARAFRAALAAKEWKDARAATVAALEAVGYPQFTHMDDGSWKYDVLPAAELTESQRIAMHPNLAYNPYAIPDPPHLRRWLGLDPPGLLEREVRFEESGAVRSAPLWQMLRANMSFAGAYCLRVVWPSAEKLIGDGAEWARRHADELLQRKGRRDGNLHVFLTLVPVNHARTEPKLVCECLRAIPAEQWTEVIAPWLGSEMPPRWIESFAAVIALHPEPALVDKLFANYKQYAEWPSRTDRSALVELGEKYPQLAGGIAKHLGRVKVTKLVFKRIAVKRGKETDLQKKQLAPVVKEYGDDARDVELCEVLDDKGAHKYDAVVLGRTEGIVFKAGTTKKVATLIQGGAEVSSVALAISLEDALDAYRKQSS